jgi:septal ring factor EnvC (AmiA/AmiB activator)
MRPFRPSRNSLPSFSILRSLCLLFLAFPFIPDIHAKDWKSEKGIIEQKIKRQNITINQLQQGLKLQQQQILETTTQERDLLAELETIEKRLLDKQAKLRALEKSMLTQKELITTKENEIGVIQTQKQKEMTHLQKRFTAYYKTGKIGAINVAFSADTMPELLSIQDSFITLIEYDKTVLRQYRQTIEGLEQTRKALILEENLLDSFISQAIQEKEAIEEDKNEKEKLLTQIRTQTKLHEQAALEIDKAQKSLTAQLATMMQKKETLSQKFLMSKGKLPAPVNGRILVRYGQSQKNKMGIEGASTGITIDASSGTKVIASHEGVIHFSGYLRGYGNTIIIDHGHQYHIVLSRIETLLKEEGEKVMAGETIGIMGETATLVEDGLYFEIRHGGATEDPLLWLEPKTLAPR